MLAFSLNKRKVSFENYEVVLQSVLIISINSRKNNNRYFQFQNMGEIIEVTLVGTWKKTHLNVYLKAHFFCRLTLCDLAGSERYGKTQNTGDRLKEAGNINTSLLTLGRCIETLRHNQAHK